jgi:hypothetical protein
MSRRLVVLVLALISLAAPAQSAAVERSPLLEKLPGSHLLSHMESEDLPPTRNFRSQFRIETADHEVQVMTFGSAVILMVKHGKASKSFAATAYLARGVARPERLQATFGKFGKVSMRFRESRNRTWFGKRRSCRGKQRYVRRRGVFVGNFRFRGEDGYVSVRLHRAKGTIVEEARKCQRSRGPIFAQASSHQSVLLAIARDGVDSTGFLTVAAKQAVFFAAHEESRGKLAIIQLAMARGQGPLRANETLTAVRVSPPAPFHGTGRYRAAPDGTTTWSGNLSVNFPGTPRFPLTGPDYETLIEIPF